MKEIQLHGKYAEGKVALVSDEDYELLSKFNWYVDSNGYAVIRVKMHQLVIDQAGIDREGLIVDHINGNKLDNNRENLRVCTHQQNIFNKKPMTGSSKYKGVYWSKKQGKWVARIAVDKHKKHIGYFVIEEDAAYAYNLYAHKLMGEFARPNVLPKDYDGSHVIIDREFSSTYRGVRMMEWGKYTATIVHEGKQYYCGAFHDEKLAALAYNKKAVKILGDEAVLNDVPWDYVSPTKDLHKRNKSGYRGVSYNKKLDKWDATISHHSKSIYCGSYEDPKEAALAYNAKSIELKGDKAKLKVID
ncbi:AP2 domain-containing protein [Neobacillus pocheonensis]|uniref:HNH endonuclease n=1 Tax=Neobacillus pocheonensis TaxID=363869 RepID=UPI003D289E52